MAPPAEKLKANAAKRAVVKPSPGTPREARASAAASPLPTPKTYPVEGASAPLPLPRLTLRAAGLLRLHARTVLARRRLPLRPRGRGRERSRTGAPSRSLSAAQLAAAARASPLAAPARSRSRAPRGPPAARLRRCRVVPREPTLARADARPRAAAGRQPQRRHLLRLH